MFYQIMLRQPNFGNRITDCLEESTKKTDHPKLVNESLMCLRQLVFTLDSISNGTGITDELAKRILLKYPTLRDSDYDGKELQNSHSV